MCLSDYEVGERSSLGDVCERRRWRMQRAIRSGSNTAIGEAVYPPKTEPMLQQGKQTHSVCEITRRSQVRALPPQPTVQTDLDIGSENPETTTVSGFFRAIFQGGIQKISFPQNDLGGGLELNSIFVIMLLLLITVLDHSFLK